MSKPPAGNRPARRSGPPVRPWWMPPKKMRPYPICRGHPPCSFYRSSSCQVTGLVLELARFFKRDYSSSRLANRFFKQCVLSFFGHQPFQMRGRGALLDSNLDLIVNNQHFKDRLPPTHSGVATEVAPTPASQRRYSAQPFRIDSE